jgi:NAD+ synthase
VALARIVETGLPLIYVNQCGGQDELVFDGGSFGFHADRTFAFQMPQLEAGIAVTTWKKTDGKWRCTDGPKAAIPDVDEANWRTCVMGLRDYVNKNGFPGVVLGLSGGIDSAVVAAMAVDALGKDRVHCVMLPYRYTSNESLSDAAAIAKTLGVRYDIVPIEAPVEGFTAALAPIFAGTPPGITEENLQSRARGTILMAISNKMGSMVVTTGNKSEMSVGYATLYGDMNGGFNPVKDLYKTEVYDLARWRNTHKPSDALGPAGKIIPENVITRPPTAELRPNQTDQDSLPPYEMLDDILESLVEGEMRISEVVAKGYDEATVRKIERLLYLAEYKRRQAAPGVKITRRNFGRDRRYPITNKFRDRG